MSDRLDALKASLPPNMAEVLDALMVSLPLWMDTHRAREAVDADASDFNRRQYLRAAVAYLEGNTYIIKALLLSKPMPDLTTAEIALLRGESYRLNEKGEPVITPAMSTLLADMRFAFRMNARSVGLSYELPVSEQGWAALGRTKKVRDRLMHPRRPSDLLVSDNELRDAMDAVDWYERQQRDLFDQVMRQSLRNTGSSEADVDAFMASRAAVERRIFAEGESPESSAG
jgi:hypothetical protein